MDSPISKSYVCKFELEDQTYLIQVKVNTANEEDFKANKHKIESIVKRAISQIDYVTQKDKNIEIQFTKDVINYSVGGKKKRYEAGQVNFKLDQHFVITELKDRILPKRERSLNEIKTDLLKWLPASIPVVSLLWDLMIHPIAQLTKWISPGEVFDSSSLKIKADPHGENSLEDALEEAVDSLESSTDEISQEAVHAFQNGLKLAKQWRDSDPSMKQKTIEALSKTLTDPKNLKPADRTTSLAVIPGGYWQSETKFEPILWSFYVNQQGELCMNDLSYGVEDSSKARVYNFGKEPDPVAIEQMIFNLLALSTKPSKLADLKSDSLFGLSYLTFLKVMLPKESNAGAGIEQESSSKPVHYLNPMTLTKFKESLTLEGGGTPEVISKEKAMGTRKIIKENPLKLIHETIRSQFKKAPLQDKALFTLHILNNRLNKILSALPTMSKEEKAQWIESLQKDYKSLERQMDKSGYQIQVAKTFESFGRHLEGLKKAVKDLESLNLQNQQERMKNLDEVVSGPYHLKISPNLLKPSEASGSTVSNTIGENDRIELNKLRTAFTEINLTSIDTSLKALTKRVDDLIANKQYESAIELHRLITPLLPSVPYGAFKHIYVKASNEVLRAKSEAFKSISDEMGKLSQYFWEAKLRTGNLVLKPDEWVHSLNIQMLMQQLVKYRKSVLKNVPENNRSLEERKFLALADPDLYTDVLYQDHIFNKLGNEKYLRPSENPDLALKFNKLKAYSDTLSKTGAGSSAGVSKYEQEMSQCRKIMEVINGTPGTLAEKEELEKAALELWKAYLHRPSQSQPFSVPSQMADISRNQLMLTSFLNPETSIGRNIGTIKGALSAAGGFIKGALGAQYSEEETHRRHLEAIEITKGYERLEIIPMLQMEIVNWGIVSRDFTPGSTADVAITPGGFAEIHAPGRRRNPPDPRELNKNLQKKALGSPNRDFEATINLTDASLSEATKLNEALTAETTHPIEDYLLKVIAGTDLSNYVIQGKGHYNPIKSTQSVHEVFDLILQRPWILETLGKNASNEESLEAVKRFYGILFTPGLIEKAIVTTPEFFIAHAEPLKRLLDKMHAEKKTTQFTFLSYLVQTVHQHIQQKLNKCEPSEKEKIQEILDKWPHINAQDHLNNFVKGFELWKNEANFSKKIDAASHLLSQFVNDKNALKPEDIPLLKNKDILTKLMQLGNIITIGKENATIPIMGIQGYLWIREYFGPYVDKLEPAVRDYCLNALVEHQKAAVSPGVPWKNVEGKPMVWEQEGTIIDLSTMQMIKYKGREVNGVEVPIPEEISSNSDYKLLFGDQKIQALFRPGKKLGEFQYSFTDESGGYYRLFYTKSSGSLIIEKEIKSQGKETWMRFCRPEFIQPAFESTTFEKYAAWIPGANQVGEKNQISAEERDKLTTRTEKQLLSSGLWVDSEHSTKGMAYLGKKIGNTPQTACHIIFDKEGKILTMKMEDGMEVVHDVDKKLVKALACLPQEQLLFLKKSGSNAITEIRFLNQPLSLHRSDDGKTWILKGDERLEGAKWVMGEERGTPANALLRHLGIHVEEIGLTVRQGAHTHLIMWPHAVTSKNPAQTKVLEFDKQYHLNPPLKVSIADGGEILSSAGGYLELAYHFAIKHDYAKAGLYLERARLAKIETKEELNLILEIENHFKTLPMTSARSAVMRLKGLLAVRQIVQEQTTRMQYKSNQWREFLSTSQEIQEAFEFYQTQLERSPFSQKAKFFKDGEGELSLTGNEINELRAITNESLTSLLSDTTKIKIDPLQLPPASSAEIQMIHPFLIMDMAKPVKEPEKLLDHLTLTEDCVVHHFFELYNLIIKNALTPDDLQPLFGPIDGLDKMGSANMEDVSKNLKAMAPFKIDIARRILLDAATANIEPESDPKNKAFDLTKMQQIKNQIPASLLSAFFNGGMAAFKAWRAKGNEQRTLALANSSEAQLVKDINQVKDQLQASKSVGVMMTLEGYKKAEESNKTVLEAFKNGKAVDFKKFQEALKSKKPLFGPVVTPILASLFAKEEVIASLKSAEGFVPLEKLLELIEDKTKINLMEIVREQEVKNRIDALESQIAAQPKNVEFAKVDSQVQLDKKDLPNPLGGNYFKIWTPVSTANQVQNLDSMVSQFEGVLKNNAGDPLESTANARLMGGLKASQASLKAMVNDKVTVPKGEHLTELFKLLDIHKKTSAKRIENLRAELLDYVNTHPDQLPKEVKKALKHFDDYGLDGIIHLLKQSYQNLELQDAEVSKILTKYLLEQVAFGVLSGEVASQIKILENLDRKGVKSDASEWISASTRIRDLTSRALLYDRYLDKEGKMINPQMMRMVLVTEATQGIVLTQEQIDLIQKMVDNPTDWYELKVGLGKTSVVFWIVLLLLAKKGQSFGALVKDELLHQNLDSLDRSSREVLDRAGVEFTFRLNDPISPSIVQEQYHRLLEVKSRQGFPITTINSVIAIDQKMQLLDEEVKSKINILFAQEGIKDDMKEKLLALMTGKKLDDLLADPKEFEKMKPYLDSIRQIEQLQKTVYYLSKIRDHFKNLLIDETDDILNVICENNVGRGNKVGFNRNIEESMQFVMKAIYTSTRPEIIKLREALFSGQQAALNQTWVKTKLIPDLARVLLTSREYKQSIGAADIDLTSLVDHLCKIYENDGDARAIPNLSQDTKTKLGALKHILQITLPVTLSQQPGINVKVKKSDGFQIGPHLLGREQAGVVFSDEFDLIVNHSLFYGIKLPDPKPGQKPADSFTGKGLRQIQDQYPDVYARWVTEAKGKNLIEFLNKKDNYTQRLEFLQLYVFRENKINRFERQIVFNVQDICYGRRIGGMTGTLSRDCLPDPSTLHAEPPIKKVTGQVILEAGILEVPKVMVTEENNIMKMMKDFALKPEYKAIINQGYYLAEGDAKKVVEQLRAANPKRSFVFVDTDSRKTYIWKTNKNEPEMVSKPELNKYAFDPNVCFYFGPADTRGTDFKIPPGKGVSFISPKCPTDDFVQTCGRARGAGKIHSMDFVISKGVESRIKERHKDKDVNYASFIDDINQQDLQQQQGKNLKTAFQSLKTIVKMGTHQLLYGHQKAFDDATYWDPASPVRFLNAYMTKQLSDIANDPQTGWLEERRGINLEQDFARSTLDLTANSVKKAYDAEMAKIDKLKALIKNPELMAQAVFATLLMSQLDPEAAEWIKQRKIDLESSIVTMKKELETAYNNIIGKLEDEENQVYPQKIPSSGSALPTAQAQVQEAQQQQQQQQELSGSGIKGVSYPEDNYRSNPLGELFVEVDTISGQKPSKKGKIANVDPNQNRKFMKFWFEAGAFNTSDNFNQLFGILGGIKGNLSTCRVLVKGKNVTLISRNDFHQAFGLNPYQSSNDPNGAYDGIYSLVNSSIYGQSLVLNQKSKRKNVPIDPLADPDVQRQIVQAKWFLGISDFTPQELVLLKIWLREVSVDSDKKATHLAFIDTYGTPEQRTKMEELLK